MIIFFHLQFFINKRPYYDVNSKLFSNFFNLITILLYLIIRVKTIRLLRNDIDFYNNIYSETPTMTENDLVAKMLDTLVKSRKELDNIDLEFTKKSLPDLDKIIEHISAPLMIMVMGEFSTGKSTFINAMVGEEVTAVNATPTTAVITKLCYGEEDKIFVHFTDGTEKVFEGNSFKQLTAKTGKDNEDEIHENIEYVERQMPFDLLQHVTIIDSPGLNDINDNHTATTKKFVNNADTVFWMFNALHAGKKTEVDAMDALTPRLKPIAIINMMDEIDEEEDDPQVFLEYLRTQLKDKVQAVIGISAKYALEGKLERNETKTEIGNLKEVEQTVKELVLPNRDKFKLNTLMDELGYWIIDVAHSLKELSDINQEIKENNYIKYLEEKTKIQQNDEILFHIVSTIKDYCISESGRFNEQALYLVGVLFYYGICVPQNEDKAELFLEKAAIKNHSFSQELLGFFYKQRKDLKKDYIKAFIWFKKAAEQGLTKSQYELGYCYKKGLGTDVNKKQATYWFKKAAEQGNKNAKLELELEIKLNQRHEQSDNSIVNGFHIPTLIEHSEQVTNANAQYALGYGYYNGLGVQTDYKQAVYWYKKAAEQGNASAQKQLGDCYYNGLGVQTDYEQAVDWYKKAAEQGNGMAQKQMGDCYYYGKGVKENYKQMVYWYKMAAEQGNKEAQCELGNCFKDGKGVKTDLSEAFKWYQKAALQGHQGAQYMVSKLRLEKVTKKQNLATKGTGCLIPMIVFICVIGALCLL